MSDDSQNYERSAVHIDELNLDKECIRLPTDYLKYAHIAADAKRDVDELKAKLEAVDADLAREIRESPGRYGIEKETEKAIAAAILLQERYQKALARVNPAKHQAE